MASTSWYWTLIHLKSSGGYAPLTLAAVGQFFQQQFPDFAGLRTLETGDDKLIQFRLMALMTDPTGESPLRLRAEQCLRCFISHQILYSCINLQAKFGKDHGFTLNDVLGIVLNDVDLSRSFFDPLPPQGYRPFAAEILTTFKPQIAGLSTWATMLTRQHNDLNNFLLEHGILQQSNWSLLNEKTPDDLRRILTDTFHLPAFEIEQACTLLSSYHGVYRRDRRGSRGKCRPPTEPQLLEIQQNAGLSLTPATVMAKLIELADYLRQHRLLSKGVLPSVPIDNPEIGSAVEPQMMSQVSSGHPEESQTLQQLYGLVNDCLDQAIQTAIHQRLTYLKKKFPDKAEKYILALKLYCCDQKTMVEIATILGLDAQWQVTRLLKVDDFLANVRRQLLKQLKERLLTLIQTEELTNDYVCADRLQTLDENHLAHLIDKPRANSSTSTVANSFFIQRLCDVVQQF